MIFEAYRLATVDQYGAEFRGSRTQSSERAKHTYEGLDEVLERMKIVTSNRIEVLRPSVIGFNNFSQCKVVTMDVIRQMSKSSYQFPMWPGSVNISEGIFTSWQGLDEKSIRNTLTLATEIFCNDMKQQGVWTPEFLEKYSLTSRSRVSVLIAATTAEFGARALKQSIIDSSFVAGALFGYCCPRSMKSTTSGTLAGCLPQDTSVSVNCWDICYELLERFGERTRSSSTSMTVSVEGAHVEDVFMSQSKVEQLLAKRDEYASVKGRAVWVDVVGGRVELWCRAGRLLHGTKSPSQVKLETERPHISSAVLCQKWFSLASPQRSAMGINLAKSANVITFSTDGDANSFDSLSRRSAHPGTVELVACESMRSSISTTIASQISLKVKVGILSHPALREEQSAQTKSFRKKLIFFGTVSITIEHMNTWASASFMDPLLTGQIRRRIPFDNVEVLTVTMTSTEQFPEKDMSRTTLAVKYRHGLMSGCKFGCFDGVKFTVFPVEQEIDFPEELDSEFDLLVHPELFMDREAWGWFHMSDKQSLTDDCSSLTSVRIVGGIPMLIVDVLALRNTPMCFFKWPRLCARNDSLDLRSERQSRLGSMEVDLLQARGLRSTLRAQWPRETHMLRICSRCNVLYDIWRCNCNAPFSNCYAKYPLLVLVTALMFRSPRNALTIANL